MDNGQQTRMKTETSLQMPRSVAKALQELLDYLWEDEEMHYICCKESGQEVGHIFESMQQIRIWFDGSSPFADDDESEN